MVEVLINPRVGTAVMHRDTRAARQQQQNLIVLALKKYIFRFFQKIFRQPPEINFPRIQNIVNPQPPEACINGNGFRLGSKVINTKNIYDAISADTNDKEMILNGDMGLITDLQGEAKSMIVQFDNPRREIIISKYGNHLKLAYALTIHRSQGSQFPVVIMPAHLAFQYQSNRALIYTAVSRAQEILITVGQASAIRQAVRDTKVYQRQTFLNEKIQDRMLEGL